MNDLILSFSLEPSHACPSGTRSYLPAPCCFDLGWYLWVGQRGQGKQKLVPRGNLVTQGGSNLSLQPELRLWVAHSDWAAGEMMGKASLPATIYSKSELL